MVSKIGLRIKHYELIAELIGKAKDLDEFYRMFVKFAQEDNEKFKVGKFYDYVQRFNQFGELGTDKRNTFQGFHTCTSECSGCTYTATEKKPPECRLA
jgi:hypothetical protein